MRKTRMFGAAISLGALLAATAATGGTASAQTTGVGNTHATTSVLNVSLGSNGTLLNVRVLGDDGSANIDPKQGASSAASDILPLTTTSSVSALNLSVPKLSVSSTGAADNKTVPSVSLATPLTAGSIAPLSLSAVVDAANGAASGLSSQLSGVSAVAGLVSVPSATSSLGAAAKPLDADGLRGLSIPSIQVLNLGAVLQGLGVNAGTLQLGQIGNVLNTLGVTVPNGSSPALTGSQLVSQVNNLSSVLTSTLPNGIQGLPAATLISALPAPLQALVASLIPGGIPVGTTNVGQLVTSLNGQITGVLGGALTGITNAPLLQVQDLVVGITTKAADTVQNSTADIKASLGSIQVGSLSVPGVDLASLVTNAQTTINSVLSQVGLGNLVTVKALDSSKSVATSGGYVNALANLTGVHVAIAPLSSLAGGTALASTDSLQQLFTLAGGGTVPQLSSAMQTLNSVLATTGAGALANGATVDVLQVAASSAFLPAGATASSPSAATPSSGSLAVTGGPTRLLGFVGLLLLATVAGLRWLRRPATTN